MKRIISIILLTTMLISMAACGQSTPEMSDNNDPNSAGSVDNESSNIESANDESDNSAEESEPYVYIPRDYLSEWADSEYEALVTDTTNDSAYIGFSKDVAMEISYEEEKRIYNEISTRRMEAYLATHSLPETKEWNHFEKTALSFLDVDVAQKLRAVTYRDAECKIEVSYNIDTGKPVRIVYGSDYWMTIHDTKKNEGKKIVNSIEEAFEYTKDYIRENLDLGDNIDLYIPTHLQISKGSYYGEDGDEYEIWLNLYANGVLINSIIVMIDDYFGIYLCNAFGYSEESMDFYADCVEYATSEKAYVSVVEALQKRADENPDIVEIKDVKLHDSGRKNAQELDDSTDYIYNPVYEEYGRITYVAHLDKTGVDLYCEYTAVMADGTEKKGLNVVTVFIPIDWAEEFGEK